MMAVAVFDSHMLSPAVIIMKPATMRGGFVPTIDSVTSAIRRCNSHRCIDNERTNPPMKRKISSCA